LDNALLEITNAQAKRQKARGSARRMGAKVNLDDVRGVLKSAGVPSQTVNSPKRSGGREHGD
jgi:hypothetical protein